MPVPSQRHYGFHSLPVVDWFCLLIYLWVLTFPFSDCSEFGNFVITLISLTCFNKYLLTLIDVHKCKHVNATSTHRRLSGFSGFTDMLMCRRVSVRSSSIMSLSGRFNSGDYHRLNHDTSAFTVASAPKMVLFFIHFYGLLIVEYV
jgi:hypothetical protein